MSRRRVTHTEKDNDGDILAICCPGARWSPRKLKDAIKDIEKGNHNYFVKKRRNRARVGVVNGPTRKYLRTYGDGTERNNLDELPIC